MEDTSVLDDFVYKPYIIKVIDRYNDNLISGEKFNQFLGTLDRWEARFKGLSMAKKKELTMALAIRD